MLGFNFFFQVFFIFLKLLILAISSGTAGQYGRSNQQVTQQSGTQQNWIYSTHQNKIIEPSNQHFSGQQSHVVNKLDFNGQQTDNSEFTAQNEDDSMERAALLTKKIMALQNTNEYPTVISGSSSNSFDQNLNQYPVSSGSHQTTSQTQSIYGNNYEQITADDIQKMTYGERLVYEDYLKLHNSESNTMFKAEDNDQSINSNLGRHSVQYEARPLSVNTEQTSGYGRGSSQVVTTSTYGAGQGQRLGHGTNTNMYTIMPNRDITQQQQISGYGTSENVISSSSSRQNSGYHITTGQGTRHYGDVSPGPAASASLMGSGYGSTPSHRGYGQSSGTSQVYETSSPDLDHTFSRNYGRAEYGSQMGSHTLSSSSSGSSIYSSGSRSGSSYGSSYGTHGSHSTTSQHDQVNRGIKA